MDRIKFYILNELNITYLSLVTAACVGIAFWFFAQWKTKRKARQLLITAIKTVALPNTERSVHLSDFPNHDFSWLCQQAEALQDLGFTGQKDFAVQCPSSPIIDPEEVFSREMFRPDVGVFASIYEVNTPKMIAGSDQVVFVRQKTTSLVSYLSCGTIVMTSNPSQSQILVPFPFVIAQDFREGCSPGQLFDKHQNLVQNCLETHPESKVFLHLTDEEIDVLDKNLKARKLVHRQSIGWVTLEELLNVFELDPTMSESNRRATVRKYRPILEAFHQEMQRQIPATERLFSKEIAEMQRLAAERPWEKYSSG